MAKKPSAKPVPATETGSQPAPSAKASVRPRLHKLRVSNFRCIGATPVEIELDDIVVLVGPNNAGKSSILRAYELVMSEGSDDGKLRIDEFPDGKPDSAKPPTIELETVVTAETKPGDKWVKEDTATGILVVKERWTWTQPGNPVRQGFDVQADKYADEGVPWGAANVAQAGRPKPHRVDAFASPEKQAEQVAKLLKEALKSSLKTLKTPKKADDGTVQAGEYQTLLETVKKLRSDLASDALKEVEEIRAKIESIVGDVFNDYKVTLDARPEEDIEAAVDLLAGTPVVRMGPAGGFHAPMTNQGSGARRTLLWAALRILAERAPAKAEAATDRPHLLLMDEPELCLHPDAIRQACRVLYDLPKTNNWQVMITTHSPVFIDFSRDNTSIVRVERVKGGAVQGTTIYRPKRAKLDDDDKAELKLLNLCDPYVAEFFFGGRTIVVEGDTEYTAFKHVMALVSGRYKGVHVVRARSKACVASLCKILNQFDKSYAVLHDADREKIVGKKSKKERKNSAWTENDKILKATADGRHAGKVRLLASIPNLEEAFFGEEADGEKPYSALVRLKQDDAAFKAFEQLLDALADSAKTVPSGALEWSDLASLSAAVTAFDSASAVALEVS